MKVLSAILTAALILPGAALATETQRQMGKHQHGHGEFNLAIDGGKVVMELRATGADIVGFEHPAKTAKEKRAIQRARKQLAERAKLFVTPAAAGCKTEKASVKIVMDTDDGHKHDDKKDAKQASGKDGAKAGGKAAKGHAHSHGHGHGHDHAHPAAGHSEFHAQYVLQCSSPEKLTTVRFDFFKRFPRAEELEVQVISGKGQARFEATPASPRIDLRKLVAR